MKKFRIVTNGKKFRIQELENGEWRFVERYVPDCSGTGYTTPVEFRSYIRALNRVGKYVKYASRKEQWTTIV